MCLALRASGFWLPFLGLRPYALHPGAIQGKEGIKFCHLATKTATASEESLPWKTAPPVVRPGIASRRAKFASRWHHYCDGESRGGEEKFEIFLAHSTTEKGIGDNFLARAPLE